MKKIIALILALVMVLALVACGTATETTETETETATIVVGASSTPHAEILEAAKPALQDAGYELEVVIYDDYVLPNTALEDGTLDANYFQHTPYLNSFNAENGTHLASAALIHYEPFGLYANGVASLEEVPAGATIIVPADDSNETRALLLLQQEGLIKLNDGVTIETGATTLDIAENNGYDIQAVQADTVPAQLANSNEGTLAVVNGNYALAAGLNVADALAVEDATGDAAQTYANIIAVREGEEESEKTTALVNALLTEAVKTFINDTYAGAVQPIF